MNNKFKFILFVAVIIAAAVGGWQLFGKRNLSSVSDSINTNQTESNTVSQKEAEIKSITSEEGKAIKLVSTPQGQYIPGEIRAKLGSKLIIEGDPVSLSGGMDTVIIDGYGIRKLIKPEDNIVEFTVDKPGTFKMYCANGMGNGKLVVE